MPSHLCVKRIHQMHRERGFHPRRRLVNEDHANPVRIELISNDPRRPTQRSSSRSVAFVRTSGRRGHPSRKDIEDRQSQDRTPQASQPEKTGRFGDLQRQLPGVTVPAAISQMQEASREMTVRRYRRPVNSAQQTLNQDHGQQHTARTHRARRRSRSFATVRRPHSPSRTPQHTG